MLTQDEIDGMRTTSTSALPDTCTITRPIEDPTLDLDTLDLDPGESETIYSGACRVRAPEAQEQATQVGDLHETLGRYIATLPWDAEGIMVDDYLTVDSSSDAGLVGRSLQIVHVAWSSWQIDRRCVLQDREQPQGVGVGS